MAEDMRASRPILRRAAVYALALLTAIHLLNHLDRRTLPMVFPLLQAEWHLSDAQLGLVATVHTLARTLVALPAGWLADRRGRVWVIRLAAASWGALGLLSGLAGQFGQFLLARVGAGLADGVGGPAEVAFLSAAFAKEKRGMVLSLYSAGLYAGSALGFMAGGLVGERWGWRWAFIAPGLLGCLCAACTGRLREPPTGERPPLGDGPAYSREILRALMVPPLPVVYLSGSLAAFATTALASWLPTFMHRYHSRSLSQAGLVTGLIIVFAGMAGLLVGGALSDRWLARSPSARFLTAVLGLWGSIPVGLLGILSPAWHPFLIGAFLAAFFLNVCVAPLTVVVQEAVLSRWRATAAGFALLITQAAGGAVATAAVGALSDAVGLRAALVLPLGAALAGGLILLSAAPRHSSRTL